MKGIVMRLLCLHDGIPSAALHDMVKKLSS